MGCHLSSVKKNDVQFEKKVLLLRYFSETLYNFATEKAYV